MIKTVFFGTHDFGASILQSMIDDGGFEIQSVITRPDMPVGRDKILQKTPVKILAEKNNLKILQPENLKEYAPTDKVDLNVVCQYGLIIPKHALDSAVHGSLNVHTSLLPKYRGASPIQSAIIHGEKTTGVTIMLMDEKMDHGHVLSQKEIQISDDDNYESLSKKLSTIAGALLVETAKKWIDGKIQPTEQDDAQATYCKILTRDDGLVQPDKTASEIYNLYRGLSPWPGIWTTWNDKRLKFLEIKKTDDTSDEAGKLANHNGRLLYFCADNTAVEILKLQLEGKKPMNATEFINGFKTLL